MPTLATLPRLAPPAAGGLHDPDDVAGVLVQRDHTVAGGERKDLAVTHRHATTGAARSEAVGGGRRRPLPLDGAVLAVDGDDTAAGRIGIDHAVDDHRRGLLARGGRSRCRHRLGRRSRGHVELPRRAEILDVGLVDLRERRVILIAEVAADFRIVRIGRRGRGGQVFAAPNAKGDAAITPRVTNDDTTTFNFI